MGRLFSDDAALQYAWVSIRARFARVRSGELERGASAVEWVVISMIVVGLCVALGVIITNALNAGAKSVSACIKGANGNNTQTKC